MARLSIYCPYCHRHTSLDIAPSIHSSGNNTAKCIWKKNEREKWWIGVCNFCHNPVLCLNDGDRIFPNPQPSPTDERIPEDIRNDLQESKDCFSLGAYRAAAVMARRSMQSACIDKGALKHKLADQIVELKTRGIISSDLQEWADVVRWVGNDAAHPNKDKVEREDAEDILKLAEQFMHIIYVTPAIAKERMVKRKKPNQ